jgi:NDP-sugar pyrophosphorylase family protein
MGTAGPLALARHLLDDGSGKPFFVLNSDVVCPYPMKDMLDFHLAREAEATILVTKVQLKHEVLWHGLGHMLCWVMNMIMGLCNMHGFGVFR